MRIAIIIFAAVILTLVLVFVFFLPTDEAAENDESLPVNGETIDDELEEPNDAVELPLGLPVYPGADFISDVVSDDEDIYLYQTTGSTEDVCAFYVAEFEAGGHEDFFYACDSEMAEVQVQSNGNLITVTAEAINGTTVIRISIRPFE